MCDSFLSVADYVQVLSELSVSLVALSLTLLCTILFFFPVFSSGFTFFSLHILFMLFHSQYIICISNTQSLADVFCSIFDSLTSFLLTFHAEFHPKTQFMVHAQSSVPFALNHWLFVEPESRQSCHFYSNPLPFCAFYWLGGETVGIKEGNYFEWGLYGNSKVQTQPTARLDSYDAQWLEVRKGWTPTSPHSIKGHYGDSLSSS